MKPIDIFILAFMRESYTMETLLFLKHRTKYPYRVWLLDNGGNSELKEHVDFYIPFKENLGVHAAWNIATGLAESEYFITSDNDIFVPDLEGKVLEVNKMAGFEVAKQKDWLGRLVELMDERPDYGAISLHPHVFIGIAGEDPNDPEDVKEAPMVGAVMRIMRKDAVLKAGGWERTINPSRNHEERTISSRLHDAGYKVGRTVRIRAYHPFGKDVEGNLGWGYNTVTPEQQGHNPQLKDEVLRFDNRESYDERTWLPK